MRLLIIRHGDPEYANDTLTRVGEKQAASVARRLASGMDGHVSHLYTSPKGRARLTASPSEKLLKKTAAVEEWTRELSYWPRLAGTERAGEGGLAMWDLSASTVRGQSGVTSGNEWVSVGEIGEAKKPYENLQMDSDAFLARHGYVKEGEAYRIVRRNRDVVAVFCHGGFGLTWLAHLLHLPLSMVWTSFFLPTSSVTTILFDERERDFASPRAIGVGDLSHLYKDGLFPLPVSKYERPNQYGDWQRPSGIKANFW